jgi:hypothetical protein
MRKIRKQEERKKREVRHIEKYGGRKINEWKRKGDEGKNNNVRLKGEKNHRKGKNEKHLRMDDS